VTEQEYLLAGNAKLGEVRKQLLEVSALLRRANEEYRETEGQLREACAWFDELLRRLREQSGQGPQEARYDDSL
jgi:hypothetical protein